MKTLHTLTALALVATMVGCSSTHVPLSNSAAQATTTYTPLPGPDANGVYRLQGYKGPEAMESNEVVQASKECIYAKMRPNVYYLMVKTDQGKVRVPVSVTCEPF
jgi:uncharacterized lipoprotein YmbA